MEETFREISESQEYVNNLKFKVKVLRLLLRYSVRLFGLEKSIVLIKSLMFLFVNSSKVIENQYCNYLIITNLFRIDVLLELSKNNYIGALEKKTLWAKYICENSLSKFARFNARGYLRLLKKEKVINYNIPVYKSGEVKNSYSTNQIYLYGPNSSNEPNIKYKNYCLTLLKDYSGDISPFSQKVLYMNSFYFTKVVNDTPIQNDLLLKYNECYVSCLTSVLPQGFTRAKFSSQGNCASLMALGRILYNYEKKYGRFDCVIEGFDLYLDKNPYANLKYPKKSRDKNGRIDETDFVFSLAEHDYIYNFLFLKDFIKKINLIDSEKFKSIMKMSWKEYAKNLHESRNFKNLRNL